MSTITTRSARIFGACLIVLALITVSGVFYNQYVILKQARCQERYNNTFVMALQARSAISDSDRQSLAELVQGVVNAKSREQSRAALQKYLATKQQNDKARAANPLPALPSDAHC